MGWDEMSVIAEFEWRLIVGRIGSHGFRVDRTVERERIARDKTVFALGERVVGTALRSRLDRKRARTGLD